MRTNQSMDGKPRPFTTPITHIHMEDDYMSDIFLEDDDVEQKGRKNIKRKGGTICEKKKEVKRTKKEEETRIRKEGLAKPIPRDNLGYSMLYKMGYKSGTALGKTGIGQTEPVPICVKGDRQGLGREIHVKEKEETNKMKQIEFLTRFQEHQRSVTTLRQVNSDLIKSQKACEQLDTTHGILQPIERWYWLSTCSLDEEDEDEEIEIIDQLLLITSYLRMNYYYCIWCGTVYEDEQELMSSCPGESYEYHDN